ncbi:DNA-3-methyladenine glycosylase I [Arthrobacter cryoconiti]|uniref:DNA-3-methyladenine glycosylase I n=1 Tax=Arthrobacter cryoconiti TaxID=748907 RepID=A0ABV8QZU4_9MICC|nr:DNA-3-methyladenine glycosylase I [Arthrobacter cryoconiti]MCC9068304.1 DNA-3-methyladenine glycosylase I [Arthrobacter cryoconiti]
MENVVVCADGLARCAWGGIETDEQYQRYHDQEWGVGATSDRELFERLSLEAFQSGLSWLTILRKREAFRDAFSNFEPEAVAHFDKADYERLMADAKIVRNRLKINATINNARALLALPEGVTLASLIHCHTPLTLRPADAPVPGSTPESAALAKDLKKNGFSFVGPTTAYAMMQAIGVVNDHQRHCWVRTRTSTASSGPSRPTSAATA